MSADGRQIGFAGLALSSQIWAQPVAPDGGRRRRRHALTSDTSQRNSLPAVSPDGSQGRLHVTRRGEPPNVWVMDIDGRDAHAADRRRDRPMASRRGSPTAGASRISRAIVTDRGLWSVDIATAPRALFFDVAAPPGTTAARADPGRPRGARSVAVGDTRGVLRADAAHRPPRAVRGRRSTPSRRGPDGRHDVGRLSRVVSGWTPPRRRDQGRELDARRLSSTWRPARSGSSPTTAARRGSRSWSPDGRRIAAAALRDGVWNLRWIDADRGRQGNLTPAGRRGVYVRYPEWSPRGNTVVFERAEMRGNIWTLNLR